MLSLMIALALAGQDMTESGLLAEGERIGRAASAMGLCEETGYTVHEDAREVWSNDYFARGAASGLSAETLRAAVDAGREKEDAEFNFTIPGGGDGSAVVALIKTYVQRVKVRCHDVAEQRAGLITDLQDGDRNADAQLEIMFGPLAR